MSHFSRRFESLHTVTVSPHCSPPVGSATSDTCVCCPTIIALRCCAGLEAAALPSERLLARRHTSQSQRHPPGAIFRPRWFLSAQESVLTKPKRESVVTESVTTYTTTGGFVLTLSSHACSSLHKSQWWQSVNKSQWWQSITIYTATGGFVLPLSSHARFSLSASLLWQITTAENTMSCVDSALVTRSSFHTLFRSFYGRVCCRSRLSRTCDGFSSRSQTVFFRTLVSYWTSLLCQITISRNKTKWSRTHMLLFLVTCLWLPRSLWWRAKSPAGVHRTKDSWPIHWTIDMCQLSYRRKRRSLPVLASPSCLSSAVGMFSEALWRCVKHSKSLVAVEPVMKQTEETTVFSVLRNRRKKSFQLSTLLSLTKSFADCLWSTTWGENTEENETYTQWTEIHNNYMKLTESLNLHLSPPPLHTYIHTYFDTNIHTSTGMHTYIHACVRKNNCFQIVR